MQEASERLGQLTRPEDPAQAGTQTGGTAPDAGERQEDFEELIRGRYKADFDARVKKILDGRLRGLRQEVTDLRQREKLRQVQIQYYLDRLPEQEKQVRMVHPEFRRQKEMENPRFFRLVQAGVEPREVKPDYDGEERMLVVDAVADLDIKLWEEEQFEMLQDVYSLKEDVRPVFEDITFEKLLMKNNAKCRASEQLQLEATQENMLQICCAGGSVQIDTHEISGNGVYVEGTVAVELLYITTDDEMPIGSLKGFLPFHQTIEVPGIEKNSRYEIESGLEQLTTILIDNTQVEIKAVINLNLIAFSIGNRKRVQEVNCQEADYESLQKIPGLVGYIVKDGDDIWNIAKENHTTVREIMETNELSSDRVGKGDKLLIVKNMGA